MMVSPKPFVLLVTGTGGASGYAVALAASTRPMTTVIWADSDALTEVSLPSGSNFIQLPRASDTNFIRVLIDECQRQAVSAIAPNVDAELTVLARHRNEFKRMNIGLWVSASQTMDTCLDKLSFSRQLSLWREDVAPATWADDEELPPPWPRGGYVVKPRRGSGARDVFHCRNPDKVRAARALVDDHIVQECATGTEFSADCLAFSDRPALVHVRERVRVRAGMSRITRPLRDDKVVEATEQLLKQLSVEGPACVQGFISEYGIRFIEVNPRFGGGCSLAEYSGGKLLTRYFDQLESGRQFLTEYSYGTHVVLVRTLDADIREEGV